MELIHKYLIETVQSYPGKKAIISDKKEISYGNLLKYVVTLSDTLILEGLHRGDRIIVMLSDPIDMITACCAVSRSGGIVVPIQTTLPVSEILDIVNRSSPFLIITSRSDYERMAKLSTGTKQITIFYDDESLSNIASSSLYHHLREFKDENWNKVLQLTNLKEFDITFMDYNTITKELSVFTHQSILHSARIINPLTSLLTDSIEFITTPIINIIGFNRVIHLLTSGGTCVIRGSTSDPLEYPSTILKHNCNTWYTTHETIMNAMNQISFLIKDTFSRIKLIGISGDVPISFQERQKLLDVFVNAKIYLNYGPPEAPTSTILSIRNNRSRLNSYGSVPPSVKLSHDSNGNILIHGPHLMEGYWRNNDLDKSRFNEKGWFKTDDFGMFDNNGDLEMVYQKDELIKRHNTYKPVTDIEENMRTFFPGCEMCIIGIQDPLNIENEVPILCYSEKGKPTINRKNLLDVFQEQFIEKNILLLVKEIKEFPKAGNKILRFELKKFLLDYNILTEIENMNKIFLYHATDN
ncbi:MAG: class I adenylate-forming enzyme family protein [Bacteroidota bacterium]|nr:class I adenylate-forming enzyme family protein [Bacteroidota bacterium]